MEQTTKRQHRIGMDPMNHDKRKISLAKLITSLPQIPRHHSPPGQAGRLQALPLQALVGEGDQVTSDGLQPVPHVSAKCLHQRPHPGLQLPARSQGRDGAGGDDREEPIVQQSVGASHTDPPVEVELVTHRIQDLLESSRPIQEPQMLPEQVPSQAPGKPARRAALAVHLSLHGLNVLHHQAELTVPDPEQTPVIDVGRAADDEPVIYDGQLGVDVDQLSDGGPFELVVGAERVESYVPIPLFDASPLQFENQRIFSPGNGLSLISLECLLCYYCFSLTRKTCPDRIWYLKDLPSSFL